VHAAALAATLQKTLGAIGVDELQRVDLASNIAERHDNAPVEHTNAMRLDAFLDQVRMSIRTRLRRLPEPRRLSPRLLLIALFRFLSRLRGGCGRPAHLLALGSGQLATGIVFPIFPTATVRPILKSASRNDAVGMEQIRTVAPTGPTPSIPGFRVASMNFTVGDDLLRRHETATLHGANKLI
jgi:hypothetical protein